MTFDGTSDGNNFSKNSSEDGFETDYDPLVAEQFAVLDGIKVPDYGARTQALPAPLAIVPTRDRFDPMYALAVAAAFLVIAAASYFALRPTTSLGLDATDGGDVEVNAEDANNPDKSAAVEDGDTNAESLTVEVAPSSTAAADSAPVSSAEETADPSDSPAEGSTGSDSGQQQATTTTTQSGSDSTAGTSGTGTTTTTSGSDGSSGSTTSVTAINPDSVLKPPTTKPGGSTVTSLDIPATSFPADGADQMVVIRGILTELFTDCQARYILNDSGNAEQVSPVSCDGGSYIVVDGKTIRTSAGYVPAGMYYDRHDPALRPGQRVVVSASAASQTPAALTLNCARCGISLGG